MQTFTHRHCDYLFQFESIERFQRIVDRILSFMQEDKDKFSHIAVSGISGISIGAPIALALKKNLMVVRKKEDITHSFNRVEGVPIETPFNYVVLDDFISSGRTLAKIHRLIEQENSYANLVNVYQYDEEKPIVFIQFLHYLEAWENHELDDLDDDDNY